MTEAAQPDTSATARRARPPSTLDYPLQPPAADGSVVEVAPGILWARMPMPMALDHINVWLLRDHDGWVIVDTGLGTDAVRERWEAIVRNHLQGLPVKAVLCTHFHYDHAGSARWLTERYGVPLLMTHGEYYLMRAMSEPPPDPLPAPHGEFFRRTGLPEDALRDMLAMLRSDPFRSDSPMAFHRLREADELSIGTRRWRVIIGEGHSPEHACLYSADDRILVAGDQLLPRITSTIQVSGVEPEANPLQLWLASLDRLTLLAPDTLVLPSHQGVFRGLHARVGELHAHHAQQLALLRERVGQAGRCSAHEAVQHLFPRLRGAMDRILALGETVAHLSWLCHEGQLRRVLDADGVYRFSVTE